MIFARAGRPARLAFVALTVALGCSKDSWVAATVGASAQAAEPAGCNGAANCRENPNCPANKVFYNPSHGEDIVLPKGFKIDVFAKDLNQPTGLAFVGNKKNFQVLVIESGKGLPGNCNNNDSPGASAGGPAENPFTPNLTIFDSQGNCLAGRSDFTKPCARGPIGKPNTGANGSFQIDGPAIGLAFENGFRGGTLFGTDSNQGVRGAPSGGGNNTSRVVTIDVQGNAVKTLIGGLPTGDHPTELIIVKDGFLYWSQGSATNSGVTGHDNGGGGNQHDIACERIQLSKNLFSSGADGHKTSGFSNHNQRRPLAFVEAFESATESGMCSRVAIQSSGASRKAHRLFAPGNLHHVRITWGIWTWWETESIGILEERW